MPFYHYLKKDHRVCLKKLAFLQFFLKILKHCNKICIFLPFYHYLKKAQTVYLKKSCLFAIFLKNVQASYLKLHFLAHSAEKMQLF